MWVTADYLPTSFFSLRAAMATTSGAKTLIVPSPFALKMALLDAALRTQGLETGQRLFPAIRDLRIALRPPEQIVVNNTFIKILRLKEVKSSGAEKAAAEAQALANRQWPFQKTIAYREYVQFPGALRIAFEGLPIETLAPLLMQVSYLGKRGGFVQLRRLPGAVEALPEEYTRITNSVDGVFPMGVMQLLDDMGPAMTFAHADIYDPKGIKLGKERVLHHVVLPYRVARSSRGFTLYERLQTEA